VVAFIASAAPARAGVVVAILPDSQTIAPGNVFDVGVSVTESGSNFNAFGLVIGFDPSALAVVPISPLSDQIGEAMTNECSNIFHDFRVGMSRDTANCSMLCPGESMTGPGEIYRLRFRALNTTLTTALTFVQQKFYAGGLLVTPIQSTGAVVRIAGPVSVAEEEDTARLNVSSAPNPARSGVLFTVHGVSDSKSSLTIFDLQGRVVRRLAVGGFSRQVAWDGSCDSGVRVKSGVFHAVVRNGDRSVQTRVVVL